MKAEPVDNLNRALSGRSIYRQQKRLAALRTLLDRGLFPKLTRGVLLKIVFLDEITLRGLLGCFAREGRREEYRSCQDASRSTWRPL